MFDILGWVPRPPLQHLTNTAAHSHYKRPSASVFEKASEDLSCYLRAQKPLY